MGIEEILIETLSVKAEDSISSVLSAMTEKRRHEAFVFNGDFRGIIVLDDLVKRRVTDPKEAKVSHFIRNVRPLPETTPNEDLMNYVMVSEFRTLPVEKDSRIRALSKPGLLKFVKDEVFGGKKASDVMHFPYAATEDEDLQTVLSMMKDLGISRVPVLDREGKFNGLADGLSLASLVIEKHRSKRGKRFGDIMKMGTIGLKTFVREDIIRTGPDVPLKSIAKEMSEKDSCTVIVESEGKFRGIITAKDIFKLMGRETESVYTRVSGLDEEDEFVRSKIYEMVGGLLKKLSKVVPLRYMAIHAETRREGGRRTMYSIKGRLVTEKWNFYADEEGWEPTKTVKGLLEKIERSVRKRIGKQRSY